MLRRLAPPFASAQRRGHFETAQRVLWIFTAPTSLCLRLCRRLCLRLCLRQPLLRCSCVKCSNIDPLPRALHKGLCDALNLNTELARLKKDNTSSHPCTSRWHRSWRCSSSNSTSTSTSTSNTSSASSTGKLRTARGRGLTACCWVSAISSAAVAAPVPPTGLLALEAGELGSVIAKDVFIGSDVFIAASCRGPAAAGPMSRRIQEASGSVSLLCVAASGGGRVRHWRGRRRPCCRVVHLLRPSANALMAISSSSASQMLFDLYCSLLYI